MKKTILTAACAMAALGVYAQGTVTMSNNNDIFAPDGHTDLGPASGGTYVAELVVNGTEVPSSICPVNGGFFFGPAATGGIVTLDGSAGAGGVSVAPGAAMTYTIEVWDTSFGATYAAAGQVGTIGNFQGTSAPFTENINAALPAAPNTGINFASFAVHQVVTVPEPTTLAMGALGAASLFLIRRRK